MNNQNMKNHYTNLKGLVRKQHTDQILQQKDNPLSD